MVTYTPAGKISPFAVQFLTELDPILEAAGVREVFLNLPHENTMTWAVKEDGVEPQCIEQKLLIGFRTGDKVWVYLPKRFDESTMQPQIHQEKDDGEVVAVGLNWPTDNPAIIIDDSVVPFNMLKRDGNTSDARYGFVAMVAYYFLVSGFDDDGVKRSEESVGNGKIMDWFITALQYIEGTEEYQRIKGHAATNGESH